MLQAQASPSPSPDADPLIAACRESFMCHTRCVDTCGHSSDSLCDDGGPGAQYAMCQLGTDCTDCGRRAIYQPPMPPVAPAAAAAEASVLLLLRPARAQHA